MGASRFKGGLGRIFKIFNSCYTCRLPLNKELPLICWGIGKSNGEGNEKKVSRGLSRVEAGNPGFPRLVQVTSGGFSWWL